MLKEQFEKVKSLVLKNSDGNNKKKIENLVVFIIILIVTIVIINYVWNDDKQTSQNEINERNSYKKLASNDNLSYSKTDLEQKLEEILSKMDGVGNVSVLVTYSQSNEIIPMYNETLKSSYTQEEDSAGGTRKVDETDSNKQIIYTEENGVNVPVTQKIVNPVIEGAIITAVGANNATVKTNIIQAVEAVTGLPTHKIQVFEMSKI